MATTAQYSSAQDPAKMCQTYGYMHESIRDKLILASPMIGLLSRPNGLTVHIFRHLNSRMRGYAHELRALLVLHSDLLDKLFDGHLQTARAAVACHVMLLACG
jgi:hypothetical protein